MPEIAFFIVVACLIGAAATFAVLPRLQRRTNKARPDKSKATGGRHTITYQDSNGEVTTRSISIKHVQMKGSKVLVRATCHLRGADRTFVAKNILEMRNEKTGQIIDQTAFLHAKVDPDLRPCLVTEKAFEIAKPLLVPLKWVANADGEVTTEEIEVLVSLCQRLTGHQEQLDKAQLASNVAELKTTLHDSRVALDPSNLATDRRAMFQEALSQLVVLGGEQSLKRAKKLAATG
jgi:predicted DNA-binding transcriptional regulator YafY